MTDLGNKEREIAIFWDYENVPLPATTRPADAAKKVKDAVSQYGRRIEMRLVYFDPHKPPHQQPRDPSGLDSSGFHLVQTPSRNMKETLDKKLIVDVLSFAWDCSCKGVEPCVVLITSDGDYAYTLSKLRDRGVMNVVMYGPQCQTAQVLIDNADVALSFEEVLGGLRTTQSSKSDETKSSASIESPTKSAVAAKDKPESYNKSQQGHRNGPPIKSPAKDQPENCNKSSQNIQSINTPPTKSVLTTKGKPENCSINKDVMAYCLCLSDKQKKFEWGLNIPYEEVFVPGAIVQESFEAPSDPSRIDARKDARDKAIEYKFVEVARKELSERNKYIIIKRLGEGCPNHLSRDYYVRLSEKGRSFLMKFRVKLLCSFLYEKQKLWEKGNNAKFEECWISSKVIEKEFSPLYPPTDRLEFNLLCKVTRDNAISSGFVETARQNASNKKFVQVPLGDKRSVNIEGLSRDFFVRLTDTGRQLIEL